MCDISIGYTQPGLQMYVVFWKSTFFFGGIGVNQNYLIVVFIQRLIDEYLQECRVSINPNGVLIFYK
jgi:hypothetical protein